MRIAEIFRSLQGEGRLTGVESVFVRASGCNLRCRFCDTPYASWSPEGEDLSVDEILDRVQRSVDSGQWSVDSGRSSEVGVQNSSFILHPSSFIHPPPTIHSPLSTDVNLQPTAYSLQPAKHIVLTGGEPMLFAELIPLCTALHNDGWHITIETSGTLYLPVACDLMSISPKLSNSTPSATGSASAFTCDPRWTWRHEANRFMPDVINRLIAEYEYQIKFVIDTPADCEEVESYLLSMPRIERSRVMLMPQGIDPTELSAKNQWLESYCTDHDLLFCPRRHVEWFGPGRGK